MILLNTILRWVLIFTIVYLIFKKRNNNPLQK